MHGTRRIDLTSMHYMTQVAPWKHWMEKGSRGLSVMRTNNFCRI
ncbi:MAG: hypothetical protein QOI57_3240 [Rubrobacteraceae bacterium]|nr:hypothetical protein [Rubrobacteraceae bacterium]